MDKIERIKELTAELLYHCHLYYDLDSPKINDAEYDKKFDTLKQLEDEAHFWLANSPTRKIQGEVLPYLEKVHHSIPMLSADKSTDIEDVVKFIGDKPVVCTYKFDGGTVVVKYNEGRLIQALSRGSGYDGENITHTARMIKNLPLTIPYNGYLEIRGEALIPWRYYNEMNVDCTLGHPRNVCTGALRQLNANEAAKRNIFFYAFTLVNWREVGVKTKSESLGFLNSCGFDVSPHMMCDPNKNDMTIKEQIECVKAFFDRKSYQNPTDGWCFEFDDLEYGESLGSTGHHDRKLYALKPEREEYETILRDVEWTLGKTGQLTPTAIFDPTEIDNTTITRASVHNISIIKSLGLKIGGKCFIHKANMIIPQILRCEGGDFPVILPKYCPVCGGETEVVTENASEVLMCKNSNCLGKLLGRLKFFVSKPAMNIDGMSEATLEFLIDKGWVKSFKDLYDLNYSPWIYEWKRTNGYGEKSVDKILEAIESSRDVKLENFICALSIDGVGKSASKTIADAFGGDFDTFYKAFEDGYNWADLSDIGEKTSANITKHLAENEAEIVELAKEMRFVAPKKAVITDSPLNGLKFCITGSFSQSRDILKDKLEAKGAKFVGGVSKNIDVLFCGEKAGSKLTKAQSLGVKVIYENEMMVMLND